MNESFVLSHLKSFSLFISLLGRVFFYLILHTDHFTSPGCKCKACTCYCSTSSTLHSLTFSRCILFQFTRYSVLSGRCKTAGVSSFSLSFLSTCSWLRTVKITFFYYSCLCFPPISGHLDIRNTLSSDRCIKPYL